MLFGLTFLLRLLNKSAVVYLLTVLYLVHTCAKQYRVKASETSFKPGRHCPTCFGADGVMTLLCLLRKRHHSTAVLACPQPYRTHRCLVETQPIGRDLRRYSSSSILNRRQMKIRSRHHPLSPFQHASTKSLADAGRCGRVAGHQCRFLPVVLFFSIPPLVVLLFPTLVWYLLRRCKSISAATRVRRRLPAVAHRRL